MDCPTKDEANSLKAYIGGDGNMTRLRKFVDYDTEGYPQIFPDESSMTTTSPASTVRRADTGSHTGSWTSGDENGCWMWTRTYQSETGSSMFHVIDVQTSQNSARAMSIRCLNNGAVKIKAQE